MIKQKKMYIFFLFLISIIPLQRIQAAEIAGHSNDFIHGSYVTVTSGSVGFGNKGTANAAPVVWDDCSGTDILTLWDGGWPVAADQPSSTPRYAPSGSIGGVTAAHGNVSKYLAMRAYDENSSGQGFPGDAMIWKQRSSVTNPSYMYVSWYQRVHPDYVSGDNFKWLDYSGGNNPYDSTGNWYLEYVGGLGGSNHINDNAAGLYQQQCDGSWGRDTECNSWYFGGSVSPINQWVKLEVLIYITDQNDGWIDLYENGVLKVNTSTKGIGSHSYNGPTDKTISSSSRNIGIGGYTRTKGVNNWRFFNDLYLDYTLAHIVLGNNSDYNKCTIKEVQVPKSWSDESISFVVNQGVFSEGQAAYLFVVDAAGSVSNSYEVTLGGAVTSSPDQTVPDAPINLIIQ